MRLLVVLAVAAGLIGLAVALVGGKDRAQRPASATPPDFIGIVPPGIASMNGAQLDQALGLAQRLHVGLLRQTFDWADIERSPGRYDFARYDALMTAASKRGLHVLAVLFTPRARRARAAAAPIRPGIPATSGSSRRSPCVVTARRAASGAPIRS